MQNISQLSFRVGDVQAAGRKNNNMKVYKTVFDNLRWVVQVGYNV